MASLEHPVSFMIWGGMSGGQCLLLITNMGTEAMVGRQLLGVIRLAEGSPSHARRTGAVRI